MTKKRDTKEFKWFYERQAYTAVENLQKKNINAQYVSDQAEALSLVLQMIPDGAIVARGDSITIDQIGIISELKKRNKNKVIDPYEMDDAGNFVVGEQEKFRMQREAFFADIFLSGINAITLDGKLVNTDGRGNRVAPIVFGPEKVILIGGSNKIVKDLQSAMKRIRQFCAPLNAIRHYVNHNRSEFGELPCVKTGLCSDCNHDWRICRFTLTIEGAMLKVKGRINLILVGEELGL